jgi:hypothetical protein
MKSIIIAAAMTIVMMGAVTLLLRYFPTRYRVRQITLAFLLALVAVALVWWLTPQNLGILPPSLLTQPPWVDLIAAVFFFATAFFGGVLQLYNLSDRGLSLRMLIDIAESPRASMTVEDVITGYSSGRGLRWMYEKRLRDMRYHDLITSRAGRIILTPRGRRTAAMFLGLRRFCKLDV